MYQSSAKFGELIRQPSRSFIRSKLVINGKTEITTGIISIKVNGASNSGDDFVIGSAPSQYLDIELVNAPVALENNLIQWFVGIEVDGAYEYIPMGVYTAEKPQTDEGSTKLTAYDNMLRMDLAYFSNLPDKTTTLAVLAEISSETGIDVNTYGLSSYPIEKPIGYTYREMLSYIAQFYAGFAICNRTGAIEIRKYTDANYTIGPSLYWDSFTHNDYPYDFLKIKCITGKDESGSDISITSGSGAREMTISNPFITQAQLNNIYNSLKDFSYMPGELKLLGDPRLDLWDIVTVIGMDGREYKVPLMKTSHLYDGGLTTEIEAVGESETESQQGFRGPQAQMYDRYAVSLALVNHAVVNKLDAEAANITYAKIKDLDVINQTVRNLDAVYAKIGDLTVTNGAIDNLKANYGNIENLLSGNAGVGDLVNIHLTTQNAVIESALIKSIVSQSITVNDLMAGTLYSNRMQIWSDESGGMKIFGATQQWTDKNKKIRMQAGIDADGIFNYYILDENGNKMFDALNGLSSSGVKNPIINDSMVSPDAAIKGSKVVIDEVGQTLSVAFTSMSTSIKAVSNKTFNLEASLNGVSAKLSDVTEDIHAIQSEGGNLILQTYVSGGRVGDSETSTIKAKILEKNVDVTTRYRPGQFVWVRCSEDPSTDNAWNDRQVTGYEITLSAGEANMVSSFICNFYIWDELPIQSSDGSEILAFDGSEIFGIS